MAFRTRADLKLGQSLGGGTVFPGRVYLDATGSEDEDGFIELFTYQLFDDDTGRSLAGPLTTRSPLATLTFDGERPEFLRATVIVEDDLRAIHDAELIIPPAATTSCSTTLFTCSLTSGQTSCHPTAANTAFSTDDLLDAAQLCDMSITKDTPLYLAMAGGSAGAGANVWPFNPDSPDGLPI